MVTRKCPALPSTFSTSERVWTRIFACLWISTILGERMHMEQSLVGNVLSSCAMCPPIVGSRSIRWTMIPWFARSSAAWMPETPAPMTTTSPMGIFPAKPHIGLRIFEDVFTLRRSSLPEHLPGYSEHDRPGRDLHALGHDCSCTDQGIFPHDSAVQYDRAHPDQHPVPDRAAMEDRPVPYGYVTPERGREPGAGMDNAVVLDVRPVADGDPVFVGPDDRAKPDTDIRS